MLQQLEAPIHPKQKAKVLEAIRTLGLKVAPADVAAAADISVAAAAQELNRVASDTNAHLVVSDAGNITYVFDPRFEQAYALRGPKNALRLTGRVIANVMITVAKVAFLAAFFVVRMSFGILLVASAVVIVGVAIASVLRLLGGGSDSGSGEGDSSGGSSGVDLSGLFDAGSSIDPTLSFNDQTSPYEFRPFWLYWCVDWLWDWTYYGDYLWWRPGYYGSRYGYSSLPDYYDNFSYETKPSQWSISAPAKQKKKSRFLDNCFTLLFGEGDPNSKLEEKRWKLIAETIKAHQGVITCEMLAPYLEATPNNEDWMLPVLLRYNGIPDVSESGHIIYSFPAFQQQLAIQAPQQKKDQTAVVDADQLRALYTGHLKRQKIINLSQSQKHESYLKEDLFTLGNFESGDLWEIFGFAGFAVAGSLALLAHPSYLPFSSVVIPMLMVICAYGASFFLIAAIRSIINNQINARISARNEQRLEFAARLNSPSAVLQQKIEEAHATAVHSMASHSESVVYMTELDALEQRFQ